MHRGSLGLWILEETENLESLRRAIEALRLESAEFEGALANAVGKAQRLERILGTVPGIVWESEGTLGEPDYRVTYVGGQLERILGYAREEWTAHATRQS